MPIYGHRARIGYTSPPADTEVFPYEFYKIVPKGVTLVLHTLPMVERTDEEIVRSYDHSLRIAKVMARAGVDLFVFGGLPINLSRGFRNADEMRRATEVELGIPVLTSAGAQQDALKALGARRVGIVQPYGPDHHARHEGYVRSFGCEPTGCVGLGVTFSDLGRVSLDRIYDACARLVRAHPNTDTIHIYCPHIATAGVTERIERELGVTVLASLQAIAWRALRRIGIEDRIPGFGRLLAAH
jgi:maleate isomerase